jgi:hypothetical protein
MVRGRGLITLVTGAARWPDSRLAAQVLELVPQSGCRHVVTRSGDAGDKTR